LRAASFLARSSARFIARYQQPGSSAHALRGRSSCDAQCKQAAPSHPLSIQPARHSAPPQARRSRSWYLLVWAETWAWVWVVCSSSSCAFGRRPSAGLLALLSLPVLAISLGACTPAREYSLCGERLAARGQQPKAQLSAVSSSRGVAAPRLRLAATRDRLGLNRPVQPWHHYRGCCACSWRLPVSALPVVLSNGRQGRA
jgi:hypothetical protein